MNIMFHSKKFYFLAGIAASFIILVFAGSIFYNKIVTPESHSVVIDSTNASGSLYPYNYRIISPPIPDNLSFAGERVPVEEFDIKERIEREFIQNTYWHSFTLLAIKRSAKYFPVIEPILKKYGIPEDFKYVAVIESGLANVVSPAGATGVWQLMQEPAESYGIEVNSEVDERYHLEKSTEAACKYLLDANARFDNWTLTAASYNMGVNGVARQLVRQFAENYYELYLNEETSRYISRIIALKEIMSNPHFYGFHITNEDLYPPLEFYEINITSPVENLADFSRKKGISYKTLKIYNPWLRDIKLTRRSGRSYTVKLPVK